LDKTNTTDVRSKILLRMNKKQATVKRLANLRYYYINARFCCQQLALLLLLAAYFKNKFVRCALCPIDLRKSPLAI